MFSSLPSILLLIAIPDISEVGDFLNVLSGGGMTSGKDGTKPIPSRRPGAEYEFLAQTPKLFFRPLHRTAAHVDEIFSAIVAMAETFVRLGFLHTVREVEDYIIAVGRVCILLNC